MVCVRGMSIERSLGNDVSILNYHQPSRWLFSVELDQYNMAVPNGAKRYYRFSIGTDPYRIRDEDFRNYRPGYWRLQWHRRGNRTSVIVSI